ncbi:MAG: aminoacyl-tRNA hydrolase [Gemmatales bacterium]|nr:aminoacyl-tRNA hydrolase [Gemmatales bacterium]MCS7158984.1 aminoacyl-tRNA hydrolase [Gemmatales bacterium]MDW8174184.1 aminoacyl-tRNA hydrolase [Gemmatales bacterium]MDW8221843.1 aminoacyl-tRNA hydrolase [Gemmatales bacterium]
MKLIVGLGNPDAEYQGTRHNVGFEVVDCLAQNWASGQSWQCNFSSQILPILLNSQKLLLIKPQTYMNRSGLAVAALVGFYQVPLCDLLVVCDDLNLALGQLRLRARGSHGGHKGLLDIQQRLGTTEYPRLRIGIGHPPLGQDAADYVLGRFRPEERPLMDQAVRRAADAVVVWVREGIDAAMNRFNERQTNRAKSENSKSKTNDDSHA